jgi:hypothetical protein
VPQGRPSPPKCQTRTRREPSEDRCQFESIRLGGRKGRRSNAIIGGEQGGFARRDAFCGEQEHGGCEPVHPTSYTLNYNNISFRLYAFLFMDSWFRPHRLLSAEHFSA